MNVRGHGRRPKPPLAFVVQVSRTVAAVFVTASFFVEPIKSDHLNVMGAVAFCHWARVVPFLILVVGAPMIAN